MAHDPSLHQTRSTASRLSDGIGSFGFVSKLNHWISATLFLGALGLGLYIENGGRTREAIGPYMQWHKAFGVAVLIYGFWRVGWRIAQGFPRGNIVMPPLAGARGATYPYRTSGRNSGHALLGRSNDTCRRA